MRLSEWQKTVLRALRAAYSREHRPVSTNTLARTLHRSRRAVQLACHELEALGFLHRPYGPKSGYAPTSDNDADAGVLFG